MKIIKQRTTTVTTTYSMEFGDPNLCAGFECDEKGSIFTPKHEAGRKNLARCLAGLDGVVCLGIKTYTSRYTSDAVGICVHCSKPVVLSSFTNTCDCNADYNMSGQLLADRSQWGEETGETADDILRIP